MVVAAVAAGFLVWITLPDVDGLREGWPERTAYMERRLEEAEEAGRVLRVSHRPVPLSRVPESVRRAVRVAEDAAFYDHGGFDWFELGEAVRRAWERGEAPRGASTITQQLARNLYLSPDRTYLRKVREALIARRLERRLGKGRIFELYLNVIELGDGVFGVEAASRLYFGRSVSDLTETQAAMLAAAIPAPRHDNPATGTRGFRWRTRLVYGRAFRPHEPGVAEIEVAPPDAAGVAGGIGPADTAFGAPPEGALGGPLPPGPDTAGAPDTADAPAAAVPVPGPGTPPADSVPPE